MVARIKMVNARMDFAQEMVRRSAPVPKYPPGTDHQGGPAMDGCGSGPEIVLRLGQIAIISAGQESILLLPSGDMIHPAKISPERLKKPLADLTPEINKQIVSDLVAQSAKEAYSRLPSFAPGVIKSGK